MHPLEPFRPVDARVIELPHDPVGDDQVTDGEPRTGDVELGHIAGALVGVSEMTVGGMRDIEVDVIFIALSGTASVVLLDGETERERSSCVRESYADLRRDCIRAGTWRRRCSRSSS